MAGFLADNNVRQPIIEALRRRGRDVVRAVDRFGEANDDRDLLAFSAEDDRILLTSDEAMHALARQWIDEGRAFRMIYWWLERHREMTDGEMADAIEEIETRPGAFAYPIEYLKPKR